MIPEVLIYPQSIECCCIKACKEHIYYYKNIYFSILHSQRNILIVVRELVSTCIIAGAEHLIIVLYSPLQKFAAACIQSFCIIAVLVAFIVWVAFIDSVAEDGGDAQPFVGWQLFHLAKELHVVLLGHRDILHGKDTVESAQQRFPVFLFHFLLLVLCQLLHVGHHTHLVVLPLQRLLCIVLQYIVRHVADAARVAQCLFSFNIPYLTGFHIFLLLHCADIIHTERQHIMVTDGIDYCVSMQSFTKGIFCGLDESCSCWHILYEDRCTGETEDVVFLEFLGDFLVHLSELASVALIENQHHFFLVDVAIWVLLDKTRQLLNGSDDDLALATGYLFLQNACRRIAVSSTLLEPVILSHGLIVQILPVHHEHHLINIGQLGGQLGSLERGQRLARARRVPDVAACLYGTVQPGIVCHLDAVQKSFSGSYLIGAHCHQDILLCQHTEAGQNIQQRMAAEEGRREILQVVQQFVLGVTPVRSEFVAIAGSLSSCLSLAVLLLDVVVASGVAVVFGCRSVRDNEDLHKLKQCIVRPERLSSISVYLVESFFQQHPSALQFYMHQWQTVHQNADIISVLLSSAIYRVLIDNLRDIVVNIFLVY